MCCNAIHVDDEEIDMQLEEVWELQRKRSKAGKGGKPKGGINLLRGNKNRRGFSLTRNKGSGNSSKNGSLTLMGRGRRSLSVGRGGFIDDDDGFSPKPRRSRSPWGRRNKQVSINKLVEKIDTKPVRPGSRGGSVVRPISRGRSRNTENSFGSRGRSRSWSLGRRSRGRSSERSLTGIVRVRSKSQERKVQKQQQEIQRRQQQYQRKVQQQQRYDESSEDETEYPRRRRSFIGRVFKRREGRNDEWSSSEEEESYYDESVRDTGGFFGAFR